MSFLPRRPALALGVLLVTACGACGGETATTGSGTPSVTRSPSATAGPTGEASTEWIAYTSERFGFSLEVPAGWTYSAATQDWPAGVYPEGGAAYTDQWALPPGPLPVLDILTQPLPQGTTREEFIADLDEGTATFCTVESTDEIVVDGSTGRLQRQTCGYNAYEVVVFDRDRVYLLYWIGGEVEDRALFEEIVSTFRFAPRTAD
jgi:hypothetical protein